MWQLKKKKVTKLKNNYVELGCPNGLVWLLQYLCNMDKYVCVCACVLWGDGAWIDSKEFRNSSKTQQFEMT